MPSPCAAYAPANYARWGVPSPSTLLETVIIAFNTALAAFPQPNHGKMDTLAKNAAKDTLTNALRTCVQAYIARNPAITNEDKEKMSLPLHDTTPPRGQILGPKPRGILRARGHTRLRR